MNMCLISREVSYTSSKTTRPRASEYLGTTEYRWHTTSNGKHPLARTTRGAFNNKRANGSGPMVQEHF